MLSLGLFHINGNAANNDTFTISLQLQTYIAGKLPSTLSPPSRTVKSNQFVAHNFADKLYYMFSGYKWLLFFILFFPLYSFSWALSFV